MSETLKKYETIKEHVYAMHTPDVLNETKRIFKENGIRCWNFKKAKQQLNDKLKKLQMDIAILDEGEYRKGATDLFGTTDIDID